MSKWSKPACTNLKDGVMGIDWRASAGASFTEVHINLSILKLLRFYNFMDQFMKK